METWSRTDSGLNPTWPPTQRSRQVSHFSGPQLPWSTAPVALLRGTLDAGAPELRGVSGEGGWDYHHCCGFWPATLSVT